ncbi:MAG: hypothetical protein N3D84_03390, partial [Candidatus Woesearchaeota archaeon]|nr:hypothetical protein [Candidatus Woesearchaeota archaeon]
LILSVKLVPGISRMVISLSKSFEKTLMSNEYVQIGVAIADVVLVYFDSKSLFTLLLLVITYNAVAQLIFRILKDLKTALKFAYYIFNIGIFIFFGSLVLIYFISYAVVLIAQSPLIAAYYYKKKKFLPIWAIEAVNCIFVLFFLYKIFI